MAESKKPCVAANCECEDFLIPKLGNLKKCADMDCGHPLGAHQGLQVASIESKKKLSMASGKHVISLDDEEDYDVQILNPEFKTVQNSMLISNQSNNDNQRKPLIAFRTEVNLARQKAASKAVLASHKTPVSRYEPQTLSTLSTLSRTTFLNSSKPLQVKTTIWTRQDGNHMVKENHLQWWDFRLEDNCMSYNNWFIEHIQNHTGWQERKGGHQIRLDFGKARPILIGETESKGDPTTIPVPVGGGTWRCLLQNIPGFLEDLPIDEAPRGTSKKKVATHSSYNIRCLSIVVPTTAVKKEQTELAPGWSPKKSARQNFKGGQISTRVSGEERRIKGETTSFMQQSGLSTPTLKSSSITNHTKLENPMSIESLIKSDSTFESNPTHFSSEQNLSKQQSLFNQPSTSLSIASPGFSDKVPKGPRKRTTSILSPEGVTIRRNIPGKRGRAIHYGQKQRHRVDSTEMSQGILHSKEGEFLEPGKDEEKGLDDDKKDESESGWSSAESLFEESISKVVEK